MTSPGAPRVGALGTLGARVRLTRLEMPMELRARENL